MTQMVMLARNRNAENLAQSEVHAYPLDFHSPPPTVLIAPCGHRLAATDAEQVNSFFGMPCVACLLVAFGRADRAADAAEPAPDLPDELAAKLLPVRSPQREPPATESGRAYSYGVAMIGDEASHLVEPDAIRSTLDGCSVAQTLCCHLAWGPLSDPVGGFPVCGECFEIALGISEKKLRTLLIRKGII
ncbi:hypothetical protein SAMN02982929_05284 [Saccharopolyspora kobensis]|uniref:Uncharacterized protein n=1 Tax=Saccharopolyspora kobensis TaxID=146035 RepID=A0A1H6DZL9_9PSEU|nr:hypothetical protein [Saccharopolyspora kobensis]SEG90651.1 hypothetical protein SAMN02982929_05284 [Saccharopolyspora kobensis]SFD92955.1 hypothetical protein SAMN05216506_107260 [Saccharopolyspora kobensis]